MEHLTKLHEELLTISEDKTEAIKVSDNESLVKWLTKERQVMQKIEEYEAVREQLVNHFFEEKGINSDEKTITELLSVLNDEGDKTKLEGMVARLLELIVSIQESEQLNSQLLQQSMQFVQLSLEMIQPQAQNISYGEQAERKAAGQKRSVFDSKV